MKTQALGFISCSETYSLVIIILLVLCCNVVAQENMFDISVATDKNSYVLGEPASTKW